MAPMFGWRRGAENGGEPDGGPERGLEDANPVELLSMLHYAGSAGRTDAAREALKLGADLNGMLQVEVRGMSLLETALHAASKCGNVDVVRLLLSEGADASIRDSTGLTAVQAAAGHQVIMAFVVEMCQRAARGEANGIGQILQAGLDPNIPDAAGNTGLHWACAFGQFESVDCLLRFEADLNVINDKVDTPLDEAEARGAEEIVKLLYSLGAKRARDIQQQVPPADLSGQNNAIPPQQMKGPYEPMQKQQGFGGNPGQGLPQDQMPGQNQQMQMPGQNQQMQMAGQNQQMQMAGQNQQMQMPGQNQQMQMPGQNQQMQMPGQNQQLQMPGQNQQMQMPGQNQQMQMPQQLASEQMSGPPLPTGQQQGPGQGPGQGQEPQYVDGMSRGNSEKSMPPRQPTNGLAGPPTNVGAPGMLTEASSQPMMQAAGGYTNPSRPQTVPVQRSNSMQGSQQAPQGAAPLIDLAGSKNNSQIVDPLQGAQIQSVGANGQMQSFKADSESYGPRPMTVPPKEPLWNSGEQLPSIQQPRRPGTAAEPTDFSGQGGFQRAFAPVSSDNITQRPQTVPAQGVEQFDQPPVSAGIPGGDPGIQELTAQTQQLSVGGGQFEGQNAPDTNSTMAPSIPLPKHLELTRSATNTRPSTRNMDSAPPTGLSSLASSAMARPSTGSDRMTIAQQQMIQQQRGPPMDQPLIDQPSMGQPPMDQPPMGQPPMGQPPMGQPPMGQPPMSQPPMGQPPMGQPPMGLPPSMGGPALGQPPMDQPSTDQPPMDQPPMGQMPMGQAPMGQPPMSQPQMGRPPSGPPRDQPQRSPQQLGPPPMDQPPMRQQSFKQSADQPPMDQPPYGQPPMDQPPYGQPPMDQPPYGQPPMDQPPMDQPPYGQPPYGQPPMNQPPYGQSPMDQPPYGQPPMNQPPYGQPPMDQPPYGQPPMDQPPFGQPPMDQPPYGQPPMDQPPYGQPPMDQPPYGQPPMDQSPYGQPPMDQPPQRQPPMDQFAQPPAGQQQAGQMEAANRSAPSPGPYFPQDQLQKPSAQSPPVVLIGNENDPQNQYSAATGYANPPPANGMAPIGQPPEDLLGRKQSISSISGTEGTRLPRWAKLLWPQPQKFYLMSDEKEFFLPPELTISAEKDFYNTSTRLAAWLQSCDLDPKVKIIAPQSGRGHIHMSVNPDMFGGRSQSYQLTVRPHEIKILGSDTAGLFYGCCTLDQIVRLVCTGGGRASLPCCSMTDWPSLAQRGVVLDISRGKVPSLSTVKLLVERLARLKYNQVQLYMEHTFGYLGHEEIWRDSGALSPEDVMTLDDHCQGLFMELVPCQSSLSGFNRWLKNPKYTHLAECPDEADIAGFDTTDPRGRMSLCAVDEKSLEFITDLYEQLLPCFKSSQLNVGLDRAADLGRSRSAKEVKTKGVETVAVEYLRKIVSVANSHGKKTIHFWSDILCGLLDQGGDLSDFSMLLPPGVVAIERGTEYDHPYDYRCYQLASIGIPFYVCASTSSQNSFGGRVSNCLENVRMAAEAGVRNAAVGMLVLDSGDNGHMQPLVSSYPGFIAGAGAAWNSKEAITPSDRGIRLLAALLDSHIFMDSEETAAIGTILATVGDINLVAEGQEDFFQGGAQSQVPRIVGGSRLFRLLVHDGETTSLAGLSPSGLQRAQNRVERSMELLQAYQGMAGRIDVEEVRLVVEFLRLCLRIGTYMVISNSSGAEEFALHWLPDVQRSDLANALIQCIDMQKYIWTKRNRLEGFQNSWGWLERALAGLSGGLPHLEQIIGAKRELEWKF